jgi:hypothetical protein
MFLYDRERDSAHVLCAGIPDSWVLDPAGIRVECLPTYHGTISYFLTSKGKNVVVDVSGGFDAAHHRLVLASPLTWELHTVAMNGREVPIPENREIVLDTLPARAEFTYR